MTHILTNTNLETRRGFHHFQACFAAPWTRILEVDVWPLVVTAKHSRCLWLTSNRKDVRASKYVTLISLDQTYKVLNHCDFLNVCCLSYLPGKQGGLKVTKLVHSTKSSQWLASGLILGRIQQELKCTVDTRIVTQGMMFACRMTNKQTCI